MKCLINTFTVILLLTSCGANAVSDKEMTTTFNVDSVGCDYTANATTIEQKKQEMQAIADSVGHFWFSDDTELQAQDPHAYWLMNRMMQMVQLIETADDGWAWMLAMNESVEQYNTRLGRYIGSVDAACNAINELIDIYKDGYGYQPQMDKASYVESILMHYKTVYVYYRLIDYIEDNDDEDNWDVQLQALYYREFKEWFDLTNAENGIMTFYTEAGSFHSALPIDLNDQLALWSKSRYDELKIETDILTNWECETYSSNAEPISSEKFSEIINYIRNMTEEDIIEQKMANFGDKDYDFARERVQGKYDFDKIAEMLRYYETALTNWRETREQIALMLPKEKQKSYREITKQMHTRLYNDLVELKDIRY